MKAVIIYESTHHGNTKKLCDAIAEKNEVKLLDATGDIPNLAEYDLIGFAAGIAYGKFYKKITEVARQKLPEGKKVFFLYTCGKPGGDFAADIRSIVESKGCTPIGVYGCKGYDTYGLLKLIGGLNKNHPSADEIQGAVNFYSVIVKS